MSADAEEAEIVSLKRIREDVESEPAAKRTKADKCEELHWNQAIRKDLKKIHQLRKISGFDTETVTEKKVAEELTLIKRMVRLGVTKESGEDNRFNLVSQSYHKLKKDAKVHRKKTLESLVATGPFTMLCNVRHIYNTSYVANAKVYNTQESILNGDLSGVTVRGLWLALLKLEANWLLFFSLDRQKLKEADDRIAGEMRPVEKISKSERAKKLHAMLQRDIDKLRHLRQNQASPDQGACTDNISLLQQDEMLLLCVEQANLFQKIAGKKVAKAMVDIFHAWKQQMEEQGVYANQLHSETPWKLLCRLLHIATQYPVDVNLYQTKESIVTDEDLSLDREMGLLLASFKMQPGWHIAKNLHQKSLLSGAVEIEKENQLGLEAAHEGTVPVNGATTDDVIVIDNNSSIHSGESNDEENHLISPNPANSEEPMPSAPLSQSESDDAQAAAYGDDTCMWVLERNAIRGVDIVPTAEGVNGDEAEVRRKREMELNAEKGRLEFHSRELVQKREFDSRKLVQKREFDSRELARTRQFELDDRRLRLDELHSSKFYAHMHQFSTLLTDFATNLKSQAESFQQRSRP